MARNSLVALTASTAAALLTGCAAVGGGAAAESPENYRFSRAADTGSQFQSGRVTVVVLDNGGRPLNNSGVDIESTGAVYFRNSGTTGLVNNTVTFTGVPVEVRISVFTPRGSYSREFIVPPSGTTELRMIVDTY